MNEWFFTILVTHSRAIWVLFLYEMIMAAICVRIEIGVLQSLQFGLSLNRLHAIMYVE